MKDSLIEIGYHKGELDFGVRATVANLTVEEIKELRSTIITAIYVAEDMWHKEQHKKLELKTEEGKE